MSSAFFFFFYSSTEFHTASEQTSLFLSFTIAVFVLLQSFDCTTRCAFNAQYYLWVPEAKLHFMLFYIYKLLFFVAVSRNPTHSEAVCLWGEQGQIIPQCWCALAWNSAQKLPKYLGSTSEKCFLLRRIIKSFAVTTMGLSDKYNLIKGKSISNRRQIASGLGNYFSGTNNQL